MRTTVRHAPRSRIGKAPQRPLPSLSGHGVRATSMPLPQMCRWGRVMPSRDLVAQLARLDEHLSLSIHEQTTQRAAVREALTRLRTGESPTLVAARLETTCPEMLAHHMGSGL